jgi:hypothetical protein
MFSRWWVLGRDELSYDIHRCQQHNTDYSRIEYAREVDDMEDTPRRRSWELGAGS